MFKNGGNVQAAEDAFQAAWNLLDIFQMVEAIYIFIFGRLFGPFVKSFGTQAWSHDDTKPEPQQPSNTSCAKRFANWSHAAINLSEICHLEWALAWTVLNICKQFPRPAAHHWARAKAACFWYSPAWT